MQPALAGTSTLGQSLLNDTSVDPLQATASLEGTLSPLRRRGTSQQPSKITLKINSPRQLQELEKIQEELHMKEQRMVKRYERFMQSSNKLEEDLRKKNIDKKQQVEIDSVQKIQHFQKQVN